MNGKVSRGKYRGRRGRKGGQGSWTPVERMVDVPFRPPLSRRSCDRDDSHDCFTWKTRQAHTNILVTNGWIQCIFGGGVGIPPREREVSKKRAAPTRRSRLGFDFLMIRECDYLVGTLYERRTLFGYIPELRNLCQPAISLPYRGIPLSPPLLGSTRVGRGDCQRRRGWENRFHSFGRTVFDGPSVRGRPGTVRPPFAGLRLIA
jgi:hypothetical protein